MERSDVLISVIVPTHQRPKLLLRALEALKNQSLPLDLFEVIVVPSPNDPSADIVERFPKELSVRYQAIPNDPFKGKNVSLKRNYGAEVARGEWLAFTDDDCVPNQKWLEAFLQKTKSDQTIKGVEGKTVTPVDSPHTLTWKGSQRLGRPNGFQTCNIFYRKDLFVKLQGFDHVNFPWFLEDTDFAWSYLDQGYSVVFSEEVVVEHPVGEAAPWRLSHEARNCGLKVRLFLKHKGLYEKYQTKALRKAHLLYLFLGLVTLLLMLTGLWMESLIVLLVYCALLFLNLMKMFYKTTFTISEFVEVAWRTALYPYQACFSLVREAIKSKVGLKDFIRIAVALKV